MTVPSQSARIAGVQTRPCCCAGARPARVCGSAALLPSASAPATGTAVAWRGQLTHSARRPSRLAASVTEQYPMDDWPVEHQLIAAASTGDLRRLRAVLSSCPDAVHARTHLPCSVASGYSALHFAAFNGHAACLWALLEAGADVHTRDDRGATPLHWLAASAGFLSLEGCGEPCLTLLVAAGADVNARDEDGETALHCAARLGNTTAIRCLAGAGTYLHALNLDGATPQTLARCAGQQEAAALLEELQADLDALLAQPLPASPQPLQQQQRAQAAGPAASEPALARLQQQVEQQLHGVAPSPPPAASGAQPTVAAGADEEALASLFGPELTGKRIRVWWADRREFVPGLVTRCIMPDRVHIVRFVGVEPEEAMQRLRLYHELLEVQGSDGRWLRYSRGEMQPRQGP